MDRANMHDCYLVRDSGIADIDDRGELSAAEIQQLIKDGVQFDWCELDKDGGHTLWESSSTFPVRPC